MMSFVLGEPRGYSPYFVHNFRFMNGFNLSGAAMTFSHWNISQNTNRNEFQQRFSNRTWGLLSRSRARYINSVHFGNIFSCKLVSGNGEWILLASADSSVMVSFKEIKEETENGRVRLCDVLNLCATKYFAILLLWNLQKLLLLIHATIALVAADGYDYPKPQFQFGPDGSLTISDDAPENVKEDLECQPPEIGEYPNCHNPTEPSTQAPRCPPGSVGEWPTCEDLIPPPFSECPQGMYGTPPDCATGEYLPPADSQESNQQKQSTTQRPGSCPAGSVGTYPNCIRNEYLPPTTEINPKLCTSLVCGR